MKTSRERPCCRLRVFETDSSLHRPSWRESQASMSSLARRLARQTCSQMSRWLAAACPTAALAAEVWHQVHYGSMAVRRWWLAAVSSMPHADAGKQLLYLATYSICYFLVRWRAFWYLSLCQLFRCGSVFDFSISQLTGWQFKPTEWNLSQPSSKLQWHTHEVMVIL